MKKILIVLSSHKEMLNTDSTSGVWLGEFTDPYYEFSDAGHQVVLASPLGGEPPVDPMSKVTQHITGSNRRFLKDNVAQQAFKNTKRLSEINAADFDAVFYPGGHGPMFDLAFNEVSGKLILDMIGAGKPVGAVCHGPAAFIQAAEIQTGFLQDKKLTAFTNTEEKMNLRADNVPFLLESRLVELGAEFTHGAIPYTSHVEVDGLLITGQNPLSAAPAAKALLEKLGSPAAQARKSP